MSLQSELEKAQAERQEVLSQMRLVSTYMHFTGELRSKLTEQQWEEVYMLGDGFGPKEWREDCERIEWDWSHVRDSSKEAVLAMYAKLMEFFPFEVGDRCRILSEEENVGEPMVGVITRFSDDGIHCAVDPHHLGDDWYYTADELVRVTEAQEKELVGS
jgi:hypothetical protein